jgi:hypothetical protein
MTRPTRLRRCIWNVVGRNAAAFSLIAMVVHVPYTFFPDPSGGTEVYVQALACEQIRRGMATMLAAPAGRDRSYVYDGLRVRRFAINPSITL